MDQNILKYLLAAIATMALMACEKEFTLNVDALEPQLSIHGFVYTDDSTVVIVESTDSLFQEESYFEPENLRLKKANVVIKSSSSASETLTFSTERNAFVGRPRQVGEQLQLEVSHPNYNTAKASCVVSEAPKVNSRSQVDTMEWADRYTVNVDLEQSQGKRYFILSVLQKTVLNRSSGDKDTITGYFASIETYDPRFYVMTDPFNMSSGDPNYIYYPIVFEKSSSADFVSTEFMFFGYETYIGFDSEEYYELSISELSEEAYRYITTVKSEEWTNGDPFASPVTIRDNIENGVGIFMAVNSSKNIIKHD